MTNIYFNFNRPSRIFSIRATKNDDKIIITSSGSIDIIDATTNALIKTIDANIDCDLCHLTHDNTKIINVCEKNNSIEIWDIATGNALRKINCKSFFNNHRILSFCITLDDKYIITFTNNSYIHVYDLNNGKELNKAVKIDIEIREPILMYNLEKFLMNCNAYINPDIASKLIMVDNNALILFKLMKMVDA